MATNNRLVDYNLRNLKVRDSAFQTFLTNIQASSNSYSIEALNECYAKLPLEWRNSDKIFIAGAWNVGNVLGYDQSGSILNMPFSNPNINRFSIVNLNYKIIDINEPCLDNLFGGFGFWLNNSISSCLRSSYIGTDAVGDCNVVGGTLASNFIGSITEKAVTYTTPIGVIWGSVGAGNYSWSGTEAAYEFLIDITELNPNRQIVISFLNGGNAIVYNLDGVRNNSVSLFQDYKEYSFILSGRKYLLIRIRRTLSTGDSSGGSGTRITIKHNTDSTWYGDTNSRIYVYPIKMGIWNKSVRAYNQAIHSSSEDILTINLTQTSDIFINTSKGAFIFRNQPVGVFDYKANGIIDCKVYNIAIKHV